MEIKIKNNNEYNINDVEEFLKQFGFDFEISEDVGNKLGIEINNNLLDENEIKQFVNEFINFVEIKNIVYIKF